MECQDHLDVELQADQLLPSPAQQSVRQDLLVSSSPLKPIRGCYLYPPLDLIEDRSDRGRYLFRLALQLTRAISFSNSESWKLDVTLPMDRRTNLSFDQSNMRSALR